VAYPGTPPPTGGTSGSAVGDQYLATRSPGGGWTQLDIQRPAGEERAVVWDALSSDLTTGVVGALPESLPSGSGAPDEYFDFFVHATVDGPDGAYQPLFTVTPPNRSNGETRLLYAGSSADGTHQLFEVNDALTPNAVDPGANAKNLYDSSDGSLALVNVLPDGTTDPNATFGAPALPESVLNPSFVPNFSHVISSDGSRIVWTDLNTTVTAQNPTGVTRLFVRLNASSLNAVTVQADASVGGGGLFATASSDGSKVFFTKEGDLYGYDVGLGQTTALAKGGGLQGLVGASEDGSYVYFVAAGALAPGATPGSCTQAGRSTEKEEEETKEEELGRIPPGRACNLYLFHAGSPKVIAALPARDNTEVIPLSGGSEQRRSGDWRADIGDRTAYVTPDGRSLIFMSKRSLTGYNNEATSISLGGAPEPITIGLDEVFLYEADAQALTCVSCNPSGEAPVATEFNTHLGQVPIGAFFPITKETYGSPGQVNTYQPRVISADGSRVFFDSAEPLVPQDTNGWLDVYEWERSGTGSCRESRGCTYLLSGGTDPESSYLLGTSASGDDVFIITRAQLVAQDRNENFDVYDARVGGVTPSAEPACPGAGCQGVPPAAPTFATPSSVVFNGVGNFPPPAPAVKPKPQSKPLTRAQQLAKALKSCRAKNNRHKRAACEAQARKRYGSKSKAKTTVANERRGK
jgi:hypothetical protein